MGEDYVKLIPTKYINWLILVLLILVILSIALEVLKQRRDHVSFPNDEQQYEYHYEFDEGDDG